MIPWLLLLAACPGPGPADDSGTKPTDTDTGTPTDTDTATGTDADSLGAAPVSVVGAASDAAGNSVAPAGDVNGDGFADLVVSAYYGNRTCVFHGPLPDGRHLLSSAATCFEGEGRYDFLGYAAEGAGDLTGDGHDDLLLGAIGNADMGTNAGKVYLAAGPFGAAVSAGDSLLAFTGAASGDYLGVSARPVGDLDGDGAVEIAMGAAGNDGSGAGGGKLYLWHTPFDVPAGTTLAAEDAPLQITGAPLPTTAAPPHGAYGGGDAVGDAVVSPGDIDGDGADDLLVGAPGRATFGSSSGMVAVFHGPVPDGVHGIDEADYRLYGSGTSQFLGSPVDRAGDTDGDGRADYLVAADGFDAGVVYLLLGSDATGEADAATVAVTRFVGERSGDEAGFGLAGGGDVDGDGSPDVLIGAPSHDEPPPGCGEGEATAERFDAGAAYVVAGPFAAGSVALGPDTRWGGECAGDNAGRSLAFAGDVDGNGTDDVVVGAIYNDDGGAFAGKAYLFYAPLRD